MNLRLRLCLFCGLLSLLLNWSSARAQTRTPHFDVPCQTRAQFADGLRGLVRAPDRVDAQLDELDIRASQTAEGAWLFSVDRVTTAEPKPRTVRESTCEAAATAGWYVTSAWIDTLEPPTPPPAPYQWSGDYLPLTEGESVVFAHQGLTVRADGSHTLGTGRNSGGAGFALALWNQSNHSIEGVSFQYLGVRIFPHELRLERTPRNQPYQRPLWELYIGVMGRVVDLRPVGIYLYGEITLARQAGAARASGARERDPLVRLDLGLAVRCALVTGWVLRGQVGLSGGGRDSYYPDPSLVASLGLDVTVR